MNPSLSKWLLIIPAILFVDWIMMTLIGIFSSVCGAGDQFYCTAYCVIGFVLLAVSFLLVAFLIFKSLPGKFRIHSHHSA
jgi:hypothetical protein